MDQNEKFQKAITLILLKEKENERNHQKQGEPFPLLRENLLKKEAKILQLVEKKKG
jgi:hypothetical protein